MQTYKVVGIMSGTSLDGVDLAYCEFAFDKQWTYKLLEAETVPYTSEWKNILSTLPASKAEKFVAVHSELGKYFGKLSKDFCRRNNLQPDFIASHGHTIFHQPSAGFTSQIGDGAALSVESGFPVICDFRAADVALGGQGAPLVPIGDKLLFHEYEYCLNLGGIANISFEQNAKRIAFDICGCNLVLNALAGRVGKEYDTGGEMAAKGKVRKDLLDKVNQSKYFEKSFPKSLGREDLETDIFPVFDRPEIPVEDLLATFCEHIAMQIGKCLGAGNVLITGGGAQNDFLIERIKSFSPAKVIIPDSKLVNFKEALIFAFLGVLRMKKEINCLSSVTGASRDNCGGTIWQP
ncbi:MAG: anhydro-N-acetylmuramic acid kinase [Bacteroidetes bacterium]|nr:anhydro-N-acetylmuramic acid kinase [Bacteroidota bacterium]